MNVMFIDTNNITLSPMASSLFQKQLNNEGRDDIFVRSAGLAAIDGQGCDWNAVEVCKEFGVDLTYHVAHKLRGKEFDGIDVFVVLEQVHKDILVEVGVNPELICLLSGGVADPYGKEKEAFVQARDQILGGLDDLEDWLTESGEEHFRRLGN